MSNPSYNRRYILKTIAGGTLLSGVAAGGTAVQSRAEGPTVYVGADDGTLYAVDAATGEQEWTFTEPQSRVRSSPTVMDGTVYVGSGDGTLYAVDAATGDQEWVSNISISTYIISSPTVVDGTVYVGSGTFDGGTLHAVDAATGDREWAFTEPSNSVWSSPTVVADPASGESIGSRVPLGTLGHHENRADRVRAFIPASFEVTITETKDTVAGEYLTVTVNVENTGDVEDSKTIETVAGDRTQTAQVSLDGGESTFVTLSIPTDKDDVGELSVTVESPDDTDQLDARVLAPSSFEVSITGTSDPVAGEDLEVTVDVENTGDVEDTQTITVDTASSTETTQVSLDGGESTTEIVSLPTDGDDSGDLSVTVTSDDDEATTSVELADPEDSGTASDDENPDDSGGIVTTETVALGSSGILAILGGLYAIQRRSNDTDPQNNDHPTSRSSDPSTDPNEPSPTNQIDDALVYAARTLDRARKTAESGDHDRALVLCKEAIDTAEDARKTAQADALDRVTDAESRLDEATSLREEIKAERDSREKADLILKTAEDSLNAAADAIEAGDITDARNSLDETATRLDETESLLSDYGFEDLDERLTNLRGRYESLDRQATRLTLETNLDELEDCVDDAFALVEDDEHEAALNDLTAVMEDLDPLAEQITSHGNKTLQDRLATLRERCEQGIDQVEKALATWPIPETIPSAPRLSLAYADVAKGELLGKGGNADVFHATVQTDDGEVALALKEPRVGGTLHTDTVERMMDEAETWQRLDDHDHIVSVVDYGGEPLPWIAMEYMDGGHLGEQIEEIDLPQKLWTALAVTRAVRHAHRRGVAHLDLKPANILFRSVEDAWDVPKVADWGLSKHLLNHSKSMDGLSPHYAAPEQFDSDSYGDADQATDVYQLGAVFYELFTGRPPFEGEPFQVMKKVESEDPQPPSTLAEVPKGLDDVLLRALATRKQDRYEDVLLLRNDLQDIFDPL